MVGSTVLAVIILIDDFTLIRDGGNFYLSVIQAIAYLLGFR